MTLADIKHVVVHILVQYIPWRFRIALHTTDSQSLALSQGVEHQSLVFTNKLFVDGSDLTGLCGQVFTQKRSEVAFADKADAGTVLFIKDIKPGLFCDFSHPWFFKFTHGE